MPSGLAAASLPTDPVNRCGCGGLTYFSVGLRPTPSPRALSPLSCGTRDGAPATGLQLPAGDLWSLEAPRGSWLLEASSWGKGGWGWALASPASPSQALPSLRGQGPPRHTYLPPSTGGEEGLEQWGGRVGATGLGAWAGETGESVSL